MVTAPGKLRFFPRQESAAHKPSGTYRIFCLGGSTTVGRPYGDDTSFCGWLRAMLPKADPTQTWEVINAGDLSYASYRIAVLMQELIRYEPDLFIVYSGHNEFLEHRTYGHLRGRPDSPLSPWGLLNRMRTYAFVKRSVDRIRSRPAAKVDGRDTLPEEVRTMLDDSVGPSAFVRDDAFQRRAIQHFRYNLDRIVASAQSCGAQVVLVTPASNLRHCSPFKSEHRAGLTEADLERWQACWDRASRAQQAGRMEEALIAAGDATAIDDRHAHLHYLRGQVLWDLGRQGEAKAAFIRGRDEDVCPLRALTPMPRTVADVARNRRVPLLDFASLAEQWSEQGVPGSAVFVDHVHPTIETHRRLALALLDTMTAQAIVRPSSAWGPAAIDTVKHEVEARIDQSDHSKALRTASQVFAWAGKYDEALSLAERAVQAAPENAESRHNHAMRLIDRSRQESAQGQVSEALRLAGRAAETTKHQDAAVLDWLATAYATAGQYERAVGTAEAALRLSAEAEFEELTDQIRTRLHRYRQAAADQANVLRQGTTAP